MSKESVCSKEMQYANIEERNQHKEIESQLKINTLFQNLEKNIMILKRKNSDSLQDDLKRKFDRSLSSIKKNSMDLTIIHNKKQNDQIVKNIKFSEIIDTENNFE